jgi:hypothetical protein
MSDVPKIVTSRLRAAAAGRDAEVHPEANLLTAFAQQALAVPERDSMLGHLALCDVCREVVHLAMDDWKSAPSPMPDDPKIARAATIPNRTSVKWWPGFKWPSLRWAGLAAGVAIVASVVALHPGRHNQIVLPGMGRSTIAGIPSVADSQALPSSDGVASNEPASAHQVTGHQTEEVGSAKNDIRTTTHFAVRSANGQTADKRAMAASDDVVLMARNDAPAIEKAKPAFPARETEGAQAATIDPGPLTHSSTAANWAIVAGVLRQSFDAGQTWQVALRADHPLLSYASRDADVWAGGERGVLFHSADGGASWNQVRPSIDDEALSSDITGIHILRNDSRGTEASNGVENPYQIILSAGAQQTWSSADGGKSWSKN